MGKATLDEFAKVLVQRVRDEAVRECDMQLRATSRTPISQHWRAAGVAPDDLVAKTIVPDCVDVVIAALLRAVDDGELRLEFKASDGAKVDLTEDGGGELVGWYLGSIDGWRERYCSERWVDYFADLVRK